ncbi:MAG: anti-sigma regulatory factor [Verrucomicrobia bacterium]|nr:anti-sigma regulatory factor [Verrucomicrobiota bacterium]
MDSVLFPGKLDSLSPIRERVNKASADAGLDADAAYKLALAIDEIATNIILHGYEEHGKSGDVAVYIDRPPGELVVTLEDTAVPYDPKTRKLPTETDLSKPLEDREIGGLGVYLAIQGVDRFDYEYVNGKNRNIFGMKLGGKAK